MNLKFDFDQTDVTEKILTVSYLVGNFFLGGLYLLRISFRNARKFYRLFDVFDQIYTAKLSRMVASMTVSNAIKPIHSVSEQFFVRNHLLG